MSASTANYLSFLVHALTGESGGAAGTFAFAGGTTGLAAAAETQRMQTAFQASRSTLRQALSKMDKLIAAIQGRSILSPTPFGSDDESTFQAVVQWLKVGANNPEGALPTVQSARSLTNRNLNLNPPLQRGGPITIKGVLRSDYHAYSLGTEAAGVTCGDVFFTTDSAECNRDVMTHECFHMLGVHHGGAPNDPETHRELIKTRAQALDSADNLAQLVSQLATGKTDSCT